MTEASMLSRASDERAEELTDFGEEQCFKISPSARRCKRGDLAERGMSECQ